MAAQVGVGLGFALGLLITAFLIVLRWPLALCFTSDPQLLALVGGAIVINAISLLGDAPQVRALVLQVQLCGVTLSALENSPK